MNRRILVSLVALGLPSAACGPYLETQVLSRSAQEATVRCTQGPFEFSLRTLGARWVEGFTLYACSSRDLQGRFRVLVDGEEPATGTWPDGKTVEQWVAGTAGGSGGTTQGSMQQVWAAVERPDNARCVATVEEQAGAGPAVVVTPLAPDGAGNSESVDVPPGGVPTGGAVVDAPTTAVVPLVPSVDFSPRMELEPAAQCLSATGRPFYRIVDHEWSNWSNEDPQSVATEAGREVSIRVWFVEPNDVEDAYFVLDQYIETPSVSDEEWIAHLKEERLEREEDQRERDEEWRAEQAEREREDAERQARCAADHADEECWGPGGYDGYVARLAAEQEEAERQAREVAANPVEPPPPPPPEPREPEGPPPASLDDPQPPRPSVHAEWVPGYWHWGGFAWGWIAGWWRAPEEDVAAGLTVRAPEAPPAPLEEIRPASPAAAAVWIAGTWQWDGTAWVWVKGNWQIPPQVEATWRPAEWRIEASGAVLLPGGWTLHVGD
jgi:hypothetical protein